MLSQFNTFLERFGLGHDNGEVPVLLAVSGGADSMCMADLFLRSGVPFSVAHCNFHLRGEESDGDEALVRAWAEANGIVFHHRDFDTSGFAKEKGQSIEMAARELRYRWFASVCRSSGCRFLAVAHNANDNAETLFLNLVRGTGVRGLSGMREVSPVPYSDPGDGFMLIRPMLQFTRKQIEGYVSANGISYRNDSTNAETEYKRNRIRHLVFPVFEKMNPSFIKTVNRDMDYFSQVESIADAYCDGIISGLESVSGKDSVMNVHELMAAGNWEYVLFRYLDRFGFNSSTALSVAALLKGDRTLGGKVFSSSTHILLTSGSSLIVRPSAGGGIPLFRPDSSGEGIMVVRCAGRYSFNGSSFEISVMDISDAGGFRQPQGTLIFDASRLSFPFVLRRWREGDWFRPLGLRGKKKISDFFTDLKLDRFRKDETVLLVDTAAPDSGSGHVAAVLCHRIDDAYKAGPDTKKIIRVKAL